MRDHDRRRRGTRAGTAVRASGTGRTGTVLGLAVVLAIAVVVIGGALWVSAHKTAESSGSIPPVTSVQDGLAVSLDRNAATVVVGPESAAVTVDVYEDFLCPACQRFERAYGTELRGKLSSGAIRVRYHLVNLLDDHSDPPGYSLRSANAALAAADVAPARFLDFCRSLFSAQPEEGARGYDTGQLVELGRRLGITDPRFSDEIMSGTHHRAVRNGLAGAVADPGLRRPGSSGGTSFGTPSIAVDGTLVDIGDPAWLDRLTAGPRPAQ
jgi:protein-disulfide isomerase